MTELRLCRVACHDCGRGYGDEHGFPDLVVPNDVWQRIAPKQDGSGMLCPSCLCRRAEIAGVQSRAEFRSGPFCVMGDGPMQQAEATAAPSDAEIEAWLKRAKHYLDLGAMRWVAPTGIIDQAVALMRRANAHRPASAPSSREDVCAALDKVRDWFDFDDEIAAVMWKHDALSRIARVRGLAESPRRCDNCGAKLGDSETTCHQCGCGVKIGALAATTKPPAPSSALREDDETMQDPRPDPFLQRTPRIGPNAHSFDKRDKMHGKLVKEGEEPPDLLRIQRDIAQDKLRDVEAELAALKAAPVAVPADVQQPKPAAVKIDRSEFRIANGVKFTADDALKLLGKDIHAYGVWCRDERDGDWFVDGWRELSQFYTYFTAPKIINAGTGEPVVPREPTAAGASQPEPAAQPDEELQRLLDAFRKDHQVRGEYQLSWARLVDALARKAGAK